MPSQDVPTWIGYGLNTGGGNYMVGNLYQGFQPVFIPGLRTQNYGYNLNQYRPQNFQAPQFNYGFGHNGPAPAYGYR